MKQYVIDEFRPKDFEAIQKYLQNNFGDSGVEGIYWIPIDNKILTKEQSEHKSCLPLFVAVDLTPERLACEFLLRTKSKMRCSCIQYATKIQRNWIIDVIDAMFEKLKVKV